MVWVHERDSAGRLARVFDFRPFGPSGPTGREDRFTWRSDGQPATVTSHGVTTTLGYRASDGLLESTTDVTGTLSLGYDAAGNVTSANDGATTVSLTYDASNRVRTITDAGGNVTTMGYAQPGCGCAHQDRVTSLRTPDLAANQQWSFDYDPDGRLAATHDPRGGTESYSYTPSGDLAQSTDRLGRSAQFTYDQLGRPITMLDPTNRVGTFAYPTAMGSGWVGPSVFAASPSSSPAPTAMTAALADGQYQVGMNLHRGGGYPAQVQYYRDATFVLSYGSEFDRYQRLAYRQDRAAIPVQSAQVFSVGGPIPGSGEFLDEAHHYNPDTPLPLFIWSSVTYPGRGERNDRDYNANLDLTLARGWVGMNSIFSAEVTYVFGRDAAGRLTSITPSMPPLPGFGPIPQSRISYLSNGNVLTASSGATRQFTYDARGLVDTMTLTFGRHDTLTIETEGVFNFDYDAVGRNTLLVYPDGHRRIQEWDELGRLTSRCYEYPGVAPTRCYTAQYDAVGNPVALGDPERNCTAVYDDLDRLRSFTCSDGTSESYDYNALGALSIHAGAPVDHQRPRLSGGGLATAGIPANHGGHPVTLDGGGRVGSLLGTTLTHSKRGKLIDAAGTTFNHDSFGRVFLWSYFQQGGVQQTELYGYDGNNIASITREFFPPGEPGQLGVAQSFVYEGTDQPLWMFDQRLNFTAYFELDAIGNVRRLRGGRSLIGHTILSDLGGYKYTAFGRQLPPDAGTPATTSRSNEFEQPLRWQARMFFPLAGGIYDFRSRVWSPELGAFLEADEFGFLTRTGTLWSWPGQNPLRWRDPSGRNPLLLPVAGGLLEGAGLGLAFGSVFFATSDREAVANAITAPIGAIGAGLAGRMLAQMLARSAAPVACEAAASGAPEMVPQIAQLQQARHMASAERLADDALVCRGGTCTADRFANGSGVTLDSAGRLQGVSVNSASNATLEQLASTIPNKQVGVTTAGQIRALGGDVIPSATRSNPFHCTLCSISPQQAEQLFTPTVRNPSLR
jgi:RHS repeat-associated protein